MFNCEKLDVRHKVTAFTDRVYERTENYPADERFGLTHQMRRAAVSVSSNIGEGACRASGTDDARFVKVVTGSLFEVVSQATISKRRGFITEEQYGMIYSADGEQSRMLSGLRASLTGCRREDAPSGPLLSTFNSPLL